MRYTVVMIILITSVSASSFIAGKSVEEREQQKLQKREIEKKSKIPKFKKSN